MDHSFDGAISAPASAFSKQMPNPPTESKTERFGKVGLAVETRKPNAPDNTYCMFLSFLAQRFKTDLEKRRWEFEEKQRWLVQTRITQKPPPPNPIQAALPFGATQNGLPRIEK
jgi:hypothetical protein